MVKKYKIMEKEPFVSAPWEWDDVEMCEICEVYAPNEERCDICRRITCDDCLARGWCVECFAEKYRQFNDRQKRRNEMKSKQKK